MLRSLDFSTASPLIQRGAAQNNTAPNDAARPGTGSGERLSFSREVTSLDRAFPGGSDQSEVPNWAGGRVEPPTLIRVPSTTSGMWVWMPIGERVR